MPVCRHLLFTFTLAVAGVAASAHARQGDPPYSLVHPAKAGANVPIVDVETLDPERERHGQASRKNGDVVDKRLRSARATAASVTTDRDGRWDRLDDGSELWRASVRASGATDLRLGLARLALPEGATLHVIGADGYYQGPYTARDAVRGSLSLPVVPGDTATLELRLRAGTARDAAAIELADVGAGFLDLFARRTPKASTGLGASGACNIDVACPLGDAYPDEIRATGHYEFRSGGNYYICTGTLLADVPRDRRNLFLTANHCIANASEAASIVVYWNYQSTRCGSLAAPAGGWLDDNQQGASLRATRADTDVTLLELDDAPDPAWNLFHAGWDATGTTPGATIGIHHPLGDAKKITAGPRPTTMGNCITGGTSASHWRAGPYSQGTTEGGSSGSALFAAQGGSNARQVIGILSGGSAACSTLTPSQPNDGYDCYGKLSASWDGASAGARLRDWLDPQGSGTRSVTGIDHDDAQEPDDEPPARTLPRDLLHSRHRR